MFQAQNKTLKDVANAPEISELVSPTPVTSVLLGSRLYKDANEEARRNEDALKRSREIGGVIENQEWGDEDSDDFLPEGDLEAEGCLVM